MAKTAKTRNPDRKNGKAWAKNHTSTVRVLSTEAQMRKAEKEDRRSKRQPQDKPGFNITMPKISWGWAQEAMAARWPNTRRVRTMDLVFAQERRGRSDPTALVSER